MTVKEYAYITLSQVLQQYQGCDEWINQIVGRCCSQSLSSEVSGKGALARKVPNSGEASSLQAASQTRETNDTPIPIDMWADPYS